MTGSFPGVGWFVLKKKNFLYFRIGNFVEANTEQQQRSARTAQLAFLKGFFITRVMLL